jgi:hypothetical protein
MEGFCNSGLFISTYSPFVCPSYRSMSPKKSTQVNSSGLEYTVEQPGNATDSFRVIMPVLIEQAKADAVVSDNWNARFIAHLCQSS